MGIVEDVEVIKKEFVAVTVLNPSDSVKVMVKHPRLLRVFRNLLNVIKRHKEWADLTVFEGTHHQWHRLRCHHCRCSL